jgi:hypothetical protein
MAPLDGFGRLATCAVQAGSDVTGAWAGAHHGLDVRLVVIGHDFIRHSTGALDRLAKESLCARSVRVVAKKHIDDHAILINGAIQVPLVLWDGKSSAE